MSFSEKTWQTGDIITADLLNRLEQALASHDTNITGVLSNLGDLTKLSTSSKGSLVSALNEVKGIIPAGGSGGSGSLVYNTLTDLQNAYPNGTTQPAWVIADNAWYYWSGTIGDTTPPTITVTPQGSVYTGSQTVTISINETGNIYYTLDGSTPTTSSTKYVSSLSIPSSCTLKILAVDLAGNQATRSDIYTINASTPPADVTNLATSNVSNASVTLAWTASATATSYDVYNGATLLGNTTSTSYQATGLTASTAYTFKVIAKNSSGSSTGVTVNATTLASAPNPVTALAVGTIAPSTVAVSWTAPSGGTAVANYEVAYEASGATSYTVSSNAVNSSSTSYTVTGLHQSTSYTIRVVAIDASGNRSQATTVSATTIALTASASPAAGTFTSSQTVTLSSNGVAGTNIYYTTDGSTPTTSSTLYSSAITVSTTKTIKFFAQNPVGDQSAVQSAVYTINLPDTTPPVVTASPAAGTYTSTQTVTLSATDNSGGTVTIYYTTDGTTPTTSSTVYTAPISISATTTLQFIGKDPSGNISTPVVATYTINAASASYVNDSSMLLHVDNPTTPYTFTNPDNYFQGSTPFTYEITVKPVVSGANAQTTLTKRLSTNVINFIWNYDNSISCALYGTQNGSAAYPSVGTGGTKYTDLTVYYHIVVMWNGSNLYLYVNNTQVASVSLPNNFTFNTSTAALQFGTDDTATLFKNVTYYNRALTSAELTQNYNALK